MIKIGDRVRFLNDVGGGVVTSFVNKNMVNVESQDGFEIPYPISELVNISEAERMEQGIAPEPETAPTQPDQKTEPAKNKGMKLAGKESPDFYFCFVPDDSKNPLSGQTSLYLVNDSNFTVLYHYSHVQDEKFNSYIFLRLWFLFRLCWYSFRLRCNSLFNPFCLAYIYQL